MRVLTLVGCLVLSLGLFVLLPEAQAEQAIALADILKPDAAPRVGGSNSLSVGGMLFNTLFVLGIGILVLKQPWFKTWAGRVKVAQEQGSTPLKAMWQASRPQARDTPAHPSHTAQTPSVLTQPSTPGEHPAEGWLEHLDTHTLDSGTKLHWIRLRGEDYVLTEGEGYSQWLRLDNGEMLEEAEILNAHAALSEDHDSIQQLPDYLDADTSMLPMTDRKAWPD